MPAQRLRSHKDLIPLQLVAFTAVPVSCQPDTAISDNALLARTWHR